MNSATKMSFIAIRLMAKLMRSMATNTPARMAMERRRNSMALRR